MNSLLLFISTFVLVFALGMQSLLVNNKHYYLAFANSLLIGIAQIGALQIINAKTTLDYIAYISGGPIAIVCSMLVFNRFVRRH